MVAETTDSNKTKKTRRLQVSNTTTVRQQAVKEQIKANAPPKPRRLAGATRSIGRPARATGRGLKKVLRPFRFLRRPLRLIGKVLGLAYFKSSWQELRLVTWPDRRTSRQLTSAVIIFALIFGLLIAGVDHGLDKLFKYILTN